MPIRRWLLVVALVAFGGLAMGADSCGTGDNGGSGGGGGSADTKKGGGDSGCGTKATDECTPHVGPKGKVRVDALIWQVKSATTSKSIGDQQYGLGEKADGMFVVVRVKVHSTKTESETITDD